eukprot:TRINITY_DN325_c0_g1_i15.p1 TRINITY_DN325_c0_g1~~TRINITY_DN325_c0_g1_i15.p1  ORF type:complete len:560 (+),score=198.99 TRINITY_DN325_c0_g1_i15:52-1731(+)
MTATIHELLAALDEKFKKYNHGWDAERKYQTYWKWFRQWDWEKKGKGLGVAAQKSVAVGLGEYEPREDPDRKQFILIQVFDEEQKIGGYSGQDPPAVWGVAITTKELAEIEKELATGEDQTALIHREPRGEPEPDAPWFVEASWVFEKDTITAIRLSIKCHQHKAPLVQEVRFKTMGDQFKLLEVVEVVAKAKVENPAKVPALPAPVSKGDAEMCAVFAPPKDAVVKAASEFTAEGDSAVELKAEGAAKPSNRGSSSRKYVQQVVVSPKLTLTNGTDSPIGITDFYLEYQEGDGMKQWKRFKNDGQSRDTIIGVSRRDWYGRMSVRSEPDLGTFTVEKHESAEVYLTGRHFMEGVLPYVEYEGTDRLHHNFLLGTGNMNGVLRCRATFIDDAKKQKSIEFEVGNPALTAGFTSYESTVAWLKENKEERDGMGDGYKCLMFMAADNPVTLERYYTVLTVAEEEPEYWILTMTTDSRKIARTSRYLYPSALEELAYTAKKEGKSEIEYETQSGMTLYALVDIESATIYGFRAELKITDPNTEEVLVERSVATTIDYSIMKQ